MDYIEPRTLKLTEIDGTHYLKLCDLERLLHDLRRNILDNAKSEPLEDGKRKYDLTETEREILNHLYFIASCAKSQLVHTCESPDEIRELAERIRKAYYVGKYCLTEKTEDENGKPMLIYFRKYCPGAMAARLKEEGKTEEEIREIMQDEEGDPAFTYESKFAKLFESMESADSYKVYLNHNYNMHLEVEPAYRLDAKVCKELLDKLLKDDDETEAGEQATTGETLKG